jgi:tetratricopeptide (TPR) repeat protein
MLRMHIPDRVQTRSRSGAWLAAALVAASACVQRPQSSLEASELRRPEDAKLQVVLDPSVERLDGQISAAWALYGATKLGLIARSEAGGEDYAIELAARDALGAFWEQRPAEGRARDLYLDTLLEVRRAGYLEEYVLATLARPGWTIPSETLAALEIPAFTEWSKRKLVGHRIETLAGVKRGDAFPLPPFLGNDLPEVAALTSGGDLCKELPRADAALDAWRDQERGLAGMALAARDRTGFLAALDRALADRTNKGRGVTWVSIKAAELSFLVGFCEAERNDIASSVLPLEMAVRLDPLVPMWRLELANALIGVSRFDAAEREIESALAQTDDPCVIGAGWRRRGYLEIERGRLDDAERFYRKSLEYDPRNDLAKLELQVIEQERAKRGELSPGPYIPPRSVSPITKICPGK